MITICLFGPESVGKTTLAIKLCQLFDAIYVPEVSREMVFDSNFSIDDIINIGQAQTKAILEAQKSGKQLIICDTDLITTQLYSKIYLEQVPEILFDLERKIIFDQYFLLNIDVPWVADGLRDLGHRRPEIYQMFKNELDLRAIDYVKVSGGWEQRTQTVIDAIKERFDLDNGACYFEIELPMTKLDNGACPIV